MPPPPGNRGSSKLPLIVIGGVVLIGAIVAIALLASGGGSGGGLASTDEVVKATVAALSAGDADALVALAPDKAALERAVECKKDAGGNRYGGGEDVDEEVEKMRRRLRDRLGEVKGATFELVETDGDGDDRDPDRVRKKGDKLGEGCVAKTDLAQHRIRAKLRVKQGERDPYNERVTLRIIQIDDRYFLERISEIELRGDAANAAGEALAKVEEFAGQMCGCRDKACADRVNDAYMKWGQDMASKAASMRDGERPDPSLTKKLTDAATRYTECYVKLATQGL
jgi:hypothetical protein